MVFAMNLLVGFRSALSDCLKVSIKCLLVPTHTFETSAFLIPIENAAKLSEKERLTISRPLKSTDTHNYGSILHHDRSRTWIQLFQYMELLSTNSHYSCSLSSRYACQFVDNKHSIFPTFSPKPPCFGSTITHPICNHNIKTIADTAHCDTYQPHSPHRRRFGVLAHAHSMRLWPSNVRTEVQCPSWRWYMMMLTS